MIKVAINGFGRIGRHVFKIIFEKHHSLKIVAVNDLADIQSAVHLLKYDSIYGSWKENEIKIKDNKIFISDQEILFLNQKDPGLLPWKDLGVDIVLECTGVFTNFEDSKKHLMAGAKKVIISAPSKNPDLIPEFILGINEKDFDPKKHDIVDMGSCTTNCLAPMVKVLEDNFGIEKGFMTTIHAYTNDQRILDLGHKDFRRARAAALNIIPTSTGAAKAIFNIFPHLKGCFSALAFRVPVPTVSLVDLTCELKTKVNPEKVNEAFERASQGELKNILAVTKEPLVSSDFIKNPYSAIVDLSLTDVIDKTVKVYGWYDNEWGYATRLAEFTEFIGKKL
jgi:glyceraldehyde 3-phosphate dehydrogenase